MKVKAIKLGYYGHKRRQEGSVFFLKDKSHFSKKWMEEVEVKAQSKSFEGPEGEKQAPKKKASKKKVSKKVSEPADLNQEVI